jgi:putative phosphoribosyl transferase
MVLARSVAAALRVPVAAVRARELYSPQAPQVAFGAVDEEGHAVLDYRNVVSLGLGEDEIHRAKDAALRELVRMREDDTGPGLDDLRPHTVVLVGEGASSALRLQAALACVLRQGVEAVVVAVPWATERAAYEIQSLLKRPEDRFVCLSVDPGPPGADEVARREGIFGP